MPAAPGQPRALVNDAIDGIRCLHWRVTETVWRLCLSPLAGAHSHFRGIGEHGRRRDEAKPISLFYPYLHKDEELRDRLEDHLGGLRRRGLIEGWHDRRIGAGSEWKDAIGEHLATADRSSFINSDYCWDKEMQKALQHARGEARVIPVV